MKPAKPLFYLVVPLAFLLMVWQMSPGSSYLSTFASRFFDTSNQFDSFDYAATGSGPSSGFTFFSSQSKVRITKKYNPPGHGSAYARLRARLEALEVKSDEFQFRFELTSGSIQLRHNALIISLFQDGSDYKDFYNKPGKKGEFASFDEY